MEFGDISADAAIAEEGAVRVMGRAAADAEPVFLPSRAQRRAEHEVAEWPALALRVPHGPPVGAGPDIGVFPARMRPIRTSNRRFRDRCLPAMLLQ